MTRAEAQQRCAELNRERAREDDCHWLVRRDESGDWSVVHVRLLGRDGGRPLKATVEAKPRPPEPPDPRPSFFRDVPPFGAA